MIQSNELRIGNYTEKGKIEEIKKHTVRVSYIDSDKLYKTSLVSYNDLQPIPLTGEILLKCGFEKGILEPKYYYIKGMMIWKGNDIFLCNKTDVVINHLHQLQNIYFALSGQELKINL